MSDLPAGVSSYGQQPASLARNATQFVTMLKLQGVAHLQSKGLQAHHDNITTDPAFAREFRGFIETLPMQTPDPQRQIALSMLIAETKAVAP